MRISTHLVVFFACLVFCAGLSADEPITLIGSTNLVTPKHGGACTAEFNLGDLPPGKEFKLDLKVFNPTDKTIFISGIPVVHCACLKFETEADSIEPNGHADFSLRIKTSSKSTMSTPFIRAQFTLTEPDNATESVNVMIKFRLKGVLAFDRNMMLMEISKADGIGNFLIPFLFTEPIDLDNLEVTCSEALNGMTFKKEWIDDQSFIRVLAPFDLVEEDDISGELIVSDTASKSRCSIMLSIQQKEPFVFSPRILRFRPTDESNRFVSTAIVRFNARNSDSTESNLEHRALRLECLSSELEITSKVIPLGNDGLVFKVLFEATTTGDELPKDVGLELELARGDFKSRIDLPTMIMEK
jgi:hypothetical protein